MRFKAITIKDIAKDLALSPSTVSRALRDSYEIAEETKKRVQAYARENNYRPNPAALSLKEKRTRTIGIVVSEIENTFYSQIIDGVDSVASDKGYNIVITQSKESVEKENHILDYLASRSVDGVIISVSAETDDFTKLQALKNSGMHIVFIDRIGDILDSHKVIADNIGGAYAATMHLIESGCKNIFVFSNNSHLSITKERIDGCKLALKEKNIPVKAEQIKHCNYGSDLRDEIKGMLDNLFKQHTKPDGFVCLSDKLTFEILNYINERNIKMPEQVRVAGFCNSNYTAFFNSSVSVIKQPAFEMGETAAKLLLQLIESRRPVTDFETKILTTKIVTRDISRKPK